MITKKYIDEITYSIIGAAIEVHKNLGPGLLESVYQQCFSREIELRNIHHVEHIWVPINYKGRSLETNLKLDMLIEDVIIVELKATEGILPVHEAQLLTYMKLLQKPKGILINFNSTNIFSNGQRTLVNEFFKDLPA